MKYKILAEDTDFGEVDIKSVHLLQLLEEGCIFTLSPTLSGSGTLLELHLSEPRKPPCPPALMFGNRTKVVNPQCAICQGMGIDPAFTTARAACKDSFPCHQCHTFHVSEMPCQSKDIAANQSVPIHEFPVHPNAEVSHG